jgi:uncharacterized RDD family membrane protein YckC
VSSQGAVHYAGFWIRVASLIIDLAVVGIPAGAIMAAANETGSATGTSIPTLAFAVYLIVLWATWGRTVGDRLVGIHLVRTDGGDVTFGTAVIRYLGLLVSAAALLLGIIWIAFNPLKQGWMDIMASTYVVYDRPRQ